MWRRGEEVVGRGVGKVFLLEYVQVAPFVGVDFPKAVWKVAVVRAREWAMAAGAPFHFGAEGGGGGAADFVGVLSVAGFEVSGEGVLVDAVFEGEKRRILDRLNGIGS